MRKPRYRHQRSRQTKQPLGPLVLLTSHGTSEDTHTATTNSHRLGQNRSTRTQTWAAVQYGLCGHPGSPGLYTLCAGSELALRGGSFLKAIANSKWLTSCHRQRETHGVTLLAAHRNSVFLRGPRAGLPHSHPALLGRGAGEALPLFTTSLGKHSEMSVDYLRGKVVSSSGKIMM